MTPAASTSVVGRWARVRQEVGRRLPRSVLDFLDRHRVHQVVRDAVLTSSPAAFAFRELRGDRELRQYRLRRCGLAFCLHHGTEDLGVLDEVFALGFYDPPPVVAQRLGRVPRPLCVVDLGAHIGMFGLWVLARFPDARITGFEPDPTNREALARTVEASGADGRWRVVPAAAAAADGRVAFARDRSSGSRIVADDGDGRSAAVPAVDVFGHLGAVDLLKIDIEGGEWALLTDERFRDVPAEVVAIEYHPHLCPGPDPRALAESLLVRAGYELHEIFHDPSGVGMLWGVRRS